VMRAPHRAANADDDEPGMAARAWGLGLGLIGVCGAGLLCAALGLAAAGMAGLGSALLAQWVPPRQQELTVPLLFDYSQGPELVAHVWLLPNAALGSSKPGRLHGRGQVMDVWMTAVMAETPPNCHVFQVEAHLLTASNASVATAARPAMLRCRSPAAQVMQAALQLPLLVLGLTSEDRILEVPLFAAYKESVYEPVASARVVVKSRAGSAVLPEFYSADVHVHLQLGLISKVLYMLRRHRMPFVTLLALACVTLGMALACGCLATAALLLARTAGRRPPASALPQGVPTEDAYSGYGSDGAPSVGTEGISSGGTSELGSESGEDASSDVLTAAAGARLWEIDGSPGERRGASSGLRQRS